MIDAWQRLRRSRSDYGVCTQCARTVGPNVYVWRNPETGVVICESCAHRLGIDSPKEEA